VIANINNLSMHHLSRLFASNPLLSVHGLLICLLVHLRLNEPTALDFSHYKKDHKFQKVFFPDVMPDAQKY